MDTAAHAPTPARWLRHLFGTRAAAARAFPPATLDALADAIAAGECTHRGQVRLIIERTLPWPALREGVAGRQRALVLFADHGVWDTEENCGVLVYVNLADRTVDIVADRGIARRVEDAAWQAICDDMTAGFARGDYRGATLDALARIAALLRQYFPADGTHTNELPDRPLML